jgi:hypothetical protein
MMAGTLGGMSEPLHKIPLEEGSGETNHEYSRRVSSSATTLNSMPRVAQIARAPSSSVSNCFIRVEEISDSFLSRSYADRVILG